MTDFIVIVILIAIVGSAIVYIVKEKKKGVKCIGCPEGCHCGGGNRTCADKCKNRGKCDNFV